MDQNLLIPLTVFVVVACFALLLQLGVLLAAFIAVLVSWIIIIMPQKRWDMRIQKEPCARVAWLC